MESAFDALLLVDAPVVIAPDGSSVKPLCTLPGVASFAHFELAPEQVSQAVSHASVQEIWYVIAGGGRMWRANSATEATTDLVPGACLTIPLGTAFQFRAGRDGLRVVAVTVPPWPGDPGEARPERGPWKAGPGV